MESTPLFPEHSRPAEPTKAELHIRTLKAKSTGQLSRRFMDVALEARPELDTVKGGRYITNVWNCRTADRTLTEAWEKAAGINQPAEAVAA